MNAPEIAVIAAAVGAALFYLVRLALRSSRRKPGCGGGCGCGVAKPGRPGTNGSAQARR